MCQGFPGSSAGKESICNAGDLSLIPGSGNSPGEGKSYPLQYGLWSVGSKESNTTIACQVPLSMVFLRQEYWNGLPFPSPGDLHNLGIEPGSPAWQADSLPLSHLGSPRLYLNEYIYLSPNSVKI